LRLVLDTNVLVAALRSDRGASRQLLLAALDQKFQLLLSVPLLIEYEAVSNRPQNLAAFGISSIEVSDILDQLVSVGTPVELAFRWRPRLRDANDDMVLETAANGDADAIVTFNLADFGGVDRLLRCDVVTPGEALLRLRGGRR
jgi:putative PIN family toxin of toxin-antitoxin system